MIVFLFAIVGVAALDNVLMNEKLVRGPNVPTTHLRGKLGTNGRLSMVDDTERPEDDAEIIARDAVRNSPGLEKTQWVVLSRYVTKNNGVTHISMRQHVNGLECSNCIFLCNIDKRGRVVNIAYTAYAGKVLPDTMPGTTAREALDDVVALWNHTVPVGAKIKTKTHTGKHHREVYAAMPGLSPYDVTVDLTMIATAADEVALTWHVSIETEDPFYHMYEAWVQANGQDAGHVIQLFDLVDWDNWGEQEQVMSGDADEMMDTVMLAEAPVKEAAHAAPRLDGSYEVYAIPHLDPDLGSRQVRRDDVDTRASPYGWHDENNGNTYTDTRGNNVCAQDNPTGSTSRGCINTYRPDGGASLEFEFEFDHFADPKSLPTKAAAVTNLFYWHNIDHDIMYMYGFDEPSGNFQENNFGRGGLGNDGVQANAQDGAGYNNANFATPIDGQRPRCRMYLWNRWTPFRDGDFDSGIIVHEVGHGVSNRLTGGPMNSGCLPGGQSGGMGEGWSDWWATQFIQEERYNPSDAFPMGPYVAPGGIRNYPYSYDMNINPATFSYLSRSGYTGVHAIGSVWCGVLHDVYWEMRAAFGWNANWYDFESPAGNIVLFQNVLNGLKLQPCRPTFLDARDAILLSDEVNYDGRHVCTMWCGFARRGLGRSATTSGYQDRNPNEAFDYPAECTCPEGGLLNNTK